MSLSEIFLVILVALIVIKPERLPEIALHLGRLLKWSRQVAAKLLYP